MSSSTRRVVTGHDAAGKAIVISDGPSPFVHVHPNNPERISTDIWRTSETPAVIAADAAEPTLGPRRQLPTPRGSVLRINQIPPETEAVRTMSLEATRQAFAAMGNEGASTFAKNGRHPMMHRTETVDYAIILSGEVTMLLDDEDVNLKAGDVVIQRGTNHAWSNRSNTTCTIAFILLDGAFDEPLAKALAGK